MSGPNTKSKLENIFNESRITKDGHTMFWQDVLADLKRLTYLEGRVLALESGQVDSYGNMKAECIGEFEMEEEISCCEDLDCDCCEGTGVYLQNFTIDWPTTKEIYKSMTAAKVRELNRENE